MWRKIEFYKGESNHEVIVTAAGGGHCFWGLFPSTRFCPLPWKTWFFLLLLEMGHWSHKKVIRIWTAKWVNWQGNFKKCSACGAYFYNNSWFFMTTKACHMQKTCSSPFHPSPSPEFLEGYPLAINQTPIKDPGWSKEEPWWGFRRQTPKSFNII